MFVRLMFVLCISTAAGLAADVAGTWKLNTAKSKYTGMPAPKELTVTYTPQGQGWRYAGKGTSADGQAMTMNFAYSKDGEEAKVTGSPNWDGIVIKNGSADVSTGTFMRGGKQVGTATRTISKDGKTMTIRGSLTMPDGKKASFVSVYEKI